MRIASPHLYLGIALAAFCLAVSPLFSVNLRDCICSRVEEEILVSDSCFDPPSFCNLTPVIPPHPGKGDIIHITEQMPLFPGCEQLHHYDIRKKCADGKMLAFIYTNLRYPPIAASLRVEGMAVISFVIEKDGRVTEPKIRRNPGVGTGEEALRVVRLMQERDIHWQPGEQACQTVRMQFNLPVKFKLD